MSGGLGRHLELSPEIITEVDALGYTAIQIFAYPPTSYAKKVNNTKLASIKKLGKRLRKRGVTCAIHASYLINLSHPPESNQAKSFVNELIVNVNYATALGESCPGAVVHMGKNVKKLALTVSQATENYLINLMEVLERTTGNVILETGAGCGTEIMGKIEELGALYQSIPDSLKHRVSFCIDTCHIWAQGYSIRRKREMKQYLDQWENEIGVDKISLIHLNDSQNPVGSKVDRHADIGYGLITGDGTEFGSYFRGLKTIVRVATEMDIPVVMETPLKNATKQSELALVSSWLE